jgi:hypothetical protein
MSRIDTGTITITGIRTTGGRRTVNRRRCAGVAALAMLSVAAIGPTADAAPPSVAPSAPHLLATLASHSGLGSTIGPDGALYFPEPAAGQISRVDPNSGAVSTFASGLPVQFIPLGGVMDVAFIDATAYALVTLVGADMFPGSPYTVGIYRIDSPTSSTVIADVGQWSIDHPPSGFSFFVPSGVQYALENYRGGFLVTDGHHNRILRVALDGTITQVASYGDVVPTGMEVVGDSVLFAAAGPTPHLPEDGKVVTLNPRTSVTTDIAAGARLAVDVERGRGQTVFALSQGTFQVGNDPGTPAMPDTGSLMKVDGHGGFTTVATGLDRPTSMEIIGNSAYIDTLDGDIWVVDNIASPPFGK